MKSSGCRSNCDNLTFQARPALRRAETAKFLSRAWSMRFFRNSCVLLLSVLLTACGGGGGGETSDGGGSSGGSVNLAQHAGTYTGTITATVTTDAGSETLQREVTFEISEDGSTLTVENQQFNLNSESFEVTVALPLPGSNVTCTLNATINGQVGNDLISGNVTGDGDCVLDGAIVQGQLSGYYSATRQ